MRYNTFFLALFLLFSSHSSFSATIAGTNTKLVNAGNIDFFLTGTQTGTSTDPDMPHVIFIDISPKNIIFTAGNSIRIMADAIYDTGKVVAIKDGFSCNKGDIKSDGLFTSSQAGKAVISIGYSGAYASIEVTVLPATPQRIQINPPASLEYGKKYPMEGLFSYQVSDRYDNEIEIDKALIKTTIKKNAAGNLLSRLIAAGGSGVQSPYVAMLRPVLISGYVSEAGEMLFFERGTYTIIAKYEGLMDTKEFAVEFSEPYKNIEAWKDYHMGELNLDNRVVVIDYDINGGIKKVICLQGDIYDRFYDNGLMCKFYAICYGHYEILATRQEMLEMSSKKVINKAFMGLIAPQGGGK